MQKSVKMKGEKQWKKMRPPPTSAILDIFEKGWYNFYKSGYETRVAGGSGHWCNYYLLDAYATKTNFVITSHQTASWETLQRDGPADWLINCRRTSLASENPVEIVKDHGHFSLYKLCRNRVASK